MDYDLRMALIELVQELTELIKEAREELRKVAQKEE